MSPNTSSEYSGSPNGTNSNPETDPSNLTSFQQNALFILSKESNYGLGIKRELEEYYGDDINHGRLYPNLDTLVEKGLVTKGEIDQRTNHYELTDAGRTIAIKRKAWIDSKLGEESGE